MQGRERIGRLLVDVRAMSGGLYRAGTVVRLAGTGSGVDACVGSEWFPLRWWEFTEGEAIDSVLSARGDGPARAGGSQPLDPHRG